MEACVQFLFLQKAFLSYNYHVSTVCQNSALSNVQIHREMNVDLSFVYFKNSWHTVRSEKAKFHCVFSTKIQTNTNFSSEKHYTSFQILNRNVSRMPEKTSLILKANKAKIV